MAAKRAPKCPSISLGDAIERVKTIYSEEGKSNFDDLTAVTHMGYSGLSGTSRTTLGSVRAYGLIEGRSPNLSVSDEAVTIIADEGVDDQKDRSQALLKALQSNSVFSGLYERFKNESSVINITSYLQKNYQFKQDAARKAAQAYKDSVDLALANGAVYDEENDEELHDSPNVGDTIQWTSGGVDMLSPPQKVRAIDDSGDWLFVENSTTGIPMNEASVIDAGVVVTAPPMAPPTMELPSQETEYVAQIDESVFMASALSKSQDNPVSFKLLVKGDMGVGEIGKLIKLLEAQKMILED